jgi:hypothetical protein
LTVAGSRTTAQQFLREVRGRDLTVGVACLQQAHDPFAFGIVEPVVRDQQRATGPVERVVLTAAMPERPLFAHDVSQMHLRRSLAPHAATLAAAETRVRSLTRQNRR